ncbi:MAG: transposase [Treponema sp.]|jgi:transposase|nr:transposase [Treponema sp.]
MGLSWKNCGIKALWQDKTVIEADMWFASSKTCHGCGYVKKDLLLQEREWVCPQCRTKHNRDKNAAINLAKLGNNLPTRRGNVMFIQFNIFCES